MGMPSFFFLYSVLWQWFPPICLLAHLFVILSHVLRYWFLQEYFSFQHCIIHLCLFKSSSSLSNFLVISCSMSPFFSQDLGSSLSSLLWILFWVGGLSPLPLLVLLRFCLVPLSGTYFYAVSFFLAFCIFGFLSAGCRILIPLVSGVCPLVGEDDPGAWAGFLVEETGACPLVGRAGSCPSDGQGHVKGCV